MDRRSEQAIREYFSVFENLEAGTSKSEHEEEYAHWRPHTPKKPEKRRREVGTPGAPTSQPSTPTPAPKRVIFAPGPSGQSTPQRQAPIGEFEAVSSGRQVLTPPVLRSASVGAQSTVQEPPATGEDVELALVD